MCRRDKYQANIREFYVETKSESLFEESHREEFRERMRIDTSGFDGDFLEGPPGPGPHGGAPRPALAIEPRSSRAPARIEDAADAPSSDDGLDSDEEHPGKRLKTKERAHQLTLEPSEEDTVCEFVCNIFPFHSKMIANTKRHVPRILPL